MQLGIANSPSRMAHSALRAATALVILLTRLLPSAIMVGRTLKLTDRSYWDL
jgi:uncharacterized membrane protein